MEQLPENLEDIAEAIEACDPSPEDEREAMKEVSTAAVARKFGSIRTTLSVKKIAKRWLLFLDRHGTAYGWDESVFQL